MIETILEWLVGFLAASYIIFFWMLFQVKKGLSLKVKAISATHVAQINALVQDHLSAEQQMYEDGWNDGFAASH